MAVAAEGPPGQNQPRQTSFVSVLINIGIMYFLYSTFVGSRQNAPAGKPTGERAAVASTPSPTTAPQQEQPSIFQMMQGQRPKTSQAELQWYDSRKAELLAAATKSSSRFVNAWGPDTSFQLHVILSESADLITDFSEITLGVGGNDGGNMTANPRAGAAQFQWNKLLDSNSNLYALTAHEPSILYENATFAGLVDNDVSCIWRLRDLHYTWDEISYRQQHFNISIPATVSHNGTLYAHIYLIKTGFELKDVNDVITEAGFLVVYPLTTTQKFRKDRAGKSLLSSSDTDQSPQTEADGSADQVDNESSHESTAIEFRNMWRPTLHIQVLHDFTAYPAQGVPPHVKSSLLVHRQGKYAPVSYVNDFWLLRNQLFPLNGSLTSVPLEITFSFQSMWKWALQSQMQASWDMQAALGTSSEGESDIFKSVILETNPVLLIVTMVVSTLHTVFDMLAFKNDISFWRNTKTMEGLSVRSIGVNVFFQVVILLYLLDNDTSWLVLISSFVGLGIEIWKLRKAITVGITWQDGRLRIKWEDAEESYARSHTKEYDDIATNHTLFILYPLVIGYAAYSLVFDKHRSWYSWILSSLTGFVYTFGFIQMVPQLYINYRMKSVAHMPWRAMIYKALNTFIDDLFAWVIKMPTLHRLAVFRDDIIFLIYLYQRWIYPVDKARRNEFGATGDDYEAIAARQQGKLRECRRGKYEKLTR